MKDIFDKVSAQCSKTTTLAYSTSFSLGIYFLNFRFRKPIYSIYGFVRFADEIVDSFHGYNKDYLLKKFREDTIEAIEQKISLNPILNSFQQVVHKYQIEWELIDTFLKSMEMDLAHTDHSKHSFDDYILGSAEVVGLMCLRVFTGGNQFEYNRLKSSAMSLGSAFQKVNFLRDAQADFEGLGRTYFPNVDMNFFNSSDKENIEIEIEDDFEKALIGIKQLPSGARRGVYLAYFYYLCLFRKIKSVPAHRIMEERIRIPNGKKMSLMLHSMLRYQLNIF